MNAEKINELKDYVWTIIVEYGLKVVGAVLILIVGLWVIGFLTRTFQKTLLKRGVDPTIIPTLRGVIKVLLLGILIIAIANIFEVEVTGLVAVLGAAGLAIGLALQGSLSNFAGGILILTLKPFKAGDYVDIDGTGGTVTGVSIMNTVLRTPDNITIFLPNGKVANANIKNYSMEPTRRWDKVFGIGYDDDFEKAKGIIMQLIEADDRFHKDPAPFVRVGNLGDSSVDITVRAWVSGSDYWNVNWDMIENVKKEFDNQGISIPFPQRDIHLYRQE